MLTYLARQRCYTMQRYDGRYLVTGCEHRLHADLVGMDEMVGRIVGG